MQCAKHFELKEARKCGATARGSSRDVRPISTTTETVYLQVPCTQHAQKTASDKIPTPKSCILLKYFTCRVFLKIQTAEKKTGLDWGRL